MLVVAPAAFDTTTVIVALVATVGFADPAVPVSPLVLVKAIPPNGRLGEEKVKLVNCPALVFCPAVLVTVTTSALELLAPYCVRLLVTVNNGSAGNTARLTLVLVVAPPALVTTTVSVALVTTAGFVPP